MSCDNELEVMLGEEDKMLRNYIIRNDAQEEFKARNENDEACLVFMRKLITKIDEYKHDDDEFDMKKRDEELDFLRDERAIATRRINTKLRRPFSFKY